MRGDGIMAKFPTYEEMAKRVAEKALDEFLYQGKSIREWVKIITEQEPILDKIRAEIAEQIIPRSSYTDKQKKQVLEIIDKYRGES